MSHAKIKPALAFANGIAYTAEFIRVESIFNNLTDKVTFRYTLLTEGLTWAGESTVTFGGEQYQSWDETIEVAYQMVVNSIPLLELENLEIIL